MESIAAEVVISIHWFLKDESVEGARTRATCRLQSLADRKPALVSTRERSVSSSENRINFILKKW